MGLNFFFITNTGAKEARGFATEKFYQGSLIFLGNFCRLRLLLFMS
jgi:hypothetical protein